MKFMFVHPCIVDLYVSALTLHILQEKLSQTGPAGLTLDVQCEVELAASEYVATARNVEKIFDSPAHIQTQLDTFSTLRQGDA
jgi:hypothetical protein